MVCLCCSPSSFFFAISFLYTHFLTNLLSVFIICIYLLLCICTVSIFLFKIIFWHFWLCLKTDRRQTFASTLFHLHLHFLGAFFFFTPSSLALTFASISTSPLVHSVFSLSKMTHRLSYHFCWKPVLSEEAGWHSQPSRDINRQKKHISYCIGPWPGHSEEADYLL